MDTNEKNLIRRTQKEEEVMKLIRQVNYGKILITVRDGEPVHAEIQKSFPIK